MKKYDLIKIERFNSVFVKKMAYKTGLACISYSSESRTNLAQTNMAVEQYNQSLHT